MSGTEPWRPSTGGLWSDVAAGLVVYGSILASPVTLPVVLAALATLSGIAPLPPLFWEMVVVSTVGLGMVVTGWIMLRVDQRERQRLLREYEGLPW